MTDIAFSCNETFIAAIMDECECTEEQAAAIADAALNLWEIVREDDGFIVFVDDYDMLDLAANAATIINQDA